MIFQIPNSQNHTAFPASLVQYKAGILPALALLTICSIGSAWAYENHNAPKNYEITYNTLSHKNSPSSSVTDLCKPLLKSNQHASSQSVTVRNRRTVGKVAALGLILGVRFALEPKSNDNINTARPGNTTKGHIIEARNSNRSALTIAAYRQCQKENILGKVARIN